MLRLLLVRHNNFVTLDNFFTVFTAEGTTLVDPDAICLDPDPTFRNVA
jgi:hypothetical protein